MTTTTIAPAITTVTRDTKMLRDNHPFALVLAAVFWDCAPGRALPANTVESPFGRERAYWYCSFADLSRADAWKLRLRAQSIADEIGASGRSCGFLLRSKNGIEVEPLDDAGCRRWAALLAAATAGPADASECCEAGLLAEAEAAPTISTISNSPAAQEAAMSITVHTTPIHPTAQESQLPSDETQTATVAIAESDAAAILASWTPSEREDLASREHIWLSYVRTASGGSGIQPQIGSCEAYAQRLGLTPMDGRNVFADTGKSGCGLDYDDRTALAAVRDIVRAKRVGKVLVEGIDRISRDLPSVLAFIAMLAEVDCELHVTGGGTPRGPVRELDLVWSDFSKVMAREQARRIMAARRNARRQSEAVRLPAATDAAVDTRAIEGPADAGPVIRIADARDGLWAAYARYVADGRDASIERQLAEYNDYAAALGLPPIIASNVFADCGTFGLGLDDRPGIRTLLEAARRKEFGKLVVADLAHLTRDPSEAIGLARELRDLDIELHVVGDGGGKVENPNAILLSALDDVALRKRMRILAAAGRRKAAFDGRNTGPTAYGYRIDASTRQVRVVAAEAEVVRRIFVQFDQGVPPSRIARTLNDEAVPTRRGGLWTINAIAGSARTGSGLLRNPLYAGLRVEGRSRVAVLNGKRKRVLCPSGEWIVVQAPDRRIVDCALWQRVVARLGADRAALWL